MSSAAEPHAILTNGSAAAAISFVPFIDQVTMAKMIAMLVLGFGSFALGVIPLQLTKRWRPQNPSPGSSEDGHHSHVGESTATHSVTFTTLLCFGGGVMLYTTLMHLQPEVRESVIRLQKLGHLPNGKGTEHLGDLIFCAGFFLVFIVDEIAHIMLDRCTAKSDGIDASVEDFLQRSMSLRCGTMSIPRPSLVSSTSAAGVSCSGVVVDGSGVSGSNSSGVIGVGGGGGTSSKVDSVKDLLKGRQYKSSGGGQTTATSNDTEQRTSSSFLERTAGSGQTHTYVGLFTVFALTFHEVFEGAAIGLEKSVENIWYLSIAVGIHKLVIAFCIGLELTSTRTRPKMLFVYLATFAFVTPVGIAIGMFIRHHAISGSSVDEDHCTVAVIVQGLATGNLLYVVFFQVLARHKQSGFSHLLSTISGFILMLIVQTFCEYLIHIFSSGLIVLLYLKNLKNLGNFFIKPKKSGLKLLVFEI